MSYPWILSAALLALAAVPSPYAPPTITISPVPPQAGGTMTITYTGKPGTELVVTWDGQPPIPPEKVVIPAGGSASVAVPATAAAVLVSDPKGGAATTGSVIAP